MLSSQPGPRFTTRPLAALALLPVALGVLSACGGSSEASSADGATTIRLALNNTASSLAAVVADDQGFFTDHELDVEITTLADISKIPPALGNQFDIGFGVQPTVIRGSAQGLDMVVVSGNGVSSTDSTDVLLMTSADSGISGPEDFAGKTLGAPTLTGNLHYATLYWLQENGVDPDSVNQVQVATPAMLDQLDQGVIDVAEVQQPFITAAEEAGMVVVEYPLAAVADPVGMSVWTASGDWAEENPDAIADYRAALDDAIAWMAEHEDETKSILATYTGQDAALVDKAPLPRFATDYTADDLAVWDEVLRSVGDFTGDVDYESLVVDLAE